MRAKIQLKKPRAKFPSEIIYTLKRKLKHDIFVSVPSSLLGINHIQFYINFFFSYTFIVIVTLVFVKFTCCIYLTSTHRKARNAHYTFARIVCRLRAFLRDCHAKTAIDYRIDLFVIIIDAMNFMKYKKLTAAKRFITQN